MKRFWLWCLCFTLFSAQTVLRPRVFRSDGAERVKRVQLPSSGGGGNTNLLTGLAAYYAMDGNANDSSVNGLNATAVNSPSFITGKVGQAVATQGYVELPVGVMDITGEMTIAGWMYIATADYNFIATRGNGGGSATYELRVEPGQSMQFYSSGGGASGGTVTTATWHHFVAIRDGLGSCFIYLDTVLVATNGCAVGTSVPAAKTYLGTRADFYKTLADGMRLDEIGFWTRAWVTADITASYNGGTGRAFSQF